MNNSHISGTSSMLVVFLEDELNKLNGISKHLKRKREDEEKTNRDDDNDETERRVKKRKIEFNVVRFLKTLSTSIMKEFDGLTVSTMEKIEAVFRNRLYWDIRKNVFISDGESKVTEEMLRQVLASRHQWLFGKALSKNQIKGQKMKKKGHR